MSEAESEADVSGKISVPSHVLVQRLSDDESVFLNLQTETYYGLDATGTAMWTALSETGDVDSARDRLLDEFDVDVETLDRDLNELVHRFIERGLLRLGDDSDRPPTSPSGS